LTRVEKSIEIRAPPEKVWEMLAIDRFKEWEEEMEKGLKSLEYTSEVRTPKDKYRVGTSGHMNLKGMGGGEFDFEITESLENEKLTYHVRRSGTNKTMGIITLILEPTEEGTKFTNVFDYEMPWGIFGKFLDKLFGKRESEKAQAKWLKKLKSILEK